MGRYFGVQIGFVLGMSDGYETRRIHLENNIRMSK